MWDEEEEDDSFVSEKFDECYLCKFKCDEPTCDDCGAGEMFEEQDPEELKEIGW